MMKRIETVVIGAGQCGLAMSACLLDAGREHIVLERGQVAQAWRERWDSLTLLSPNWFTRLPRYRYSGDDPNGFIGRDEIVQFFADYASLLETPIECGFDVTRVHPIDGSNRIIVRGADGTSFDADNVVVAIGGYHRPKVPPVSKLLRRTVVQIHSNHYRTPGQLPPGAVLVVGAGASGQQIAEELMRSGRIVYMSVGSHNKLPRRSRTRHDLVDGTAWDLRHAGRVAPLLGGSHAPTEYFSHRCRWWTRSRSSGSRAGRHDSVGSHQPARRTHAYGSPPILRPALRMGIRSTHASWRASIDTLSKRGLRCDPSDARRQSRR